MTSRAPTGCDVLVIGAGVTGLAVARALARRFHGLKLVVLEKERAVAAHASGRNSGVLHAGFYYSADSLKARFTRQGNQTVSAYCEEHGLPVNRCGKLVVARNQGDLLGLDELLRRAERNDVPLFAVSPQEAREIEPRVRTVERALWSPSTASIDPKSYVQTLGDDVTALGVDVRLGTAYCGARGGTIDTTLGRVEARFVINAAGLQADRIARDFGFARSYRILPFKGLYLYSSEPPGSIRTNIYPVPDLRNPFLGVHFTVTVDGHVKIGPTAIPALWREQYGWDRFSVQDLTEVVGLTLSLMAGAGFDFRGLAISEVSKYLRPLMVRRASRLATDVRPSQYRRWAPPGIRAQLLNMETRTLEMDFVLEGDDRSLHVLNVVSPGLTCSLPFAEYIVDRVAPYVR